MKVDFRHGAGALVPIFMPDLLFRLDADGKPLFTEFAAAIEPTEFVPGKVFGSGTMPPIDYLVALADGRIAPPEPRSRYRPAPGARRLIPLPHPPIPVAPRRGLEGPRLHRDARRLAELNARSKFWGDDQRAAFKNWEEIGDPRNPLGGRQGVNERIMLRELLRRVDMMVILENKLDALVRLHTPLPPGKIGGAGARAFRAPPTESLYGPNAGLTEVLIPAGYVTTAYDPVFELSADGKVHLVPATSRPHSRSPACRSRWCSAPSRARRTSCSKSRSVRSRVETPRAAAGVWAAPGGAARPFGRSLAA